MSWLLLLTLPAGALFACWHPRWAARRDWQAIQADGAKDSLKERFHFLRGAQRGILQALVSMVAAAPLLPAFWPWVLVATGIGIASLAYFFYDFNPRLNVLRSIDPYYVSFDARAAYFPDRWLQRQARERAVGYWIQKEVASDLLQDLLTHVLIVGLAVGFVLCFVGILLYHA